VNTLAIDVGGTGLKAAVLDPKGLMTSDRVRVDTPVGKSPPEFVQALCDLVAPLPAYDRIAIGFPGMVRNGVVHTAPHLGHDGWRGFHLAEALAEKLGRPCRLANDADVQGFAVISGKGLEMVLTLGTGFGTALYEDGRLCPHLEIGHHPFRKGETYDQQLSDATRREVGNKKWSKRVLKAIATLRNLTEFDHMYIGGGNARKLECTLPADVTIVDNTAGILGGVFLWHTDGQGT
jgi:polyphosphate glucokinase